MPRSSLRPPCRDKRPRSLIHGKKSTHVLLAARDLLEIQEMFQKMLFLAGFLLSFVVHVEGECRSPLSWPWNSSSIWNTPLGSAAEFGYTSLYPEDDGPNLTPRCSFWALGIDEVVFLPTTNADPIVSWFNQGHWGPPKTPEAYCSISGEEIGKLHVPYNFTSPLGGASGNPGPSTAWGGNYPVVLLQPDQQTVLLSQPVYRCAPGSPWLSRKPQDGFEYANIVTDNGNLGSGHGGSGLSGLGGAIRMGEMLPNSPPIRHALQIEFWAQVGRACIDNPDLPVNFVIDSLASLETAEKDKKSFKRREI